MNRTIVVAGAQGALSARLCSLAHVEASAPVAAQLGARA